jgi:ribosome maturation protein Sdo1
MIREISRKDKKKGEILKGLSKKGEVEIHEIFESTFEVIIRPAINNHDLYFSDKNIKLALHNKAIKININKPVNKIVDEILLNVKKDLIEKTCKG